MLGDSFSPTLFGHIALSEDRSSPSEVGTLVVPFTAGAQLKVGDVVYLSASQTVNKSATGATFGGKIVGIVVGGGSSSTGVVKGVCLEKNSVGAIAANTGELVWVAVHGIAKVYTDGAVTLGATLAGSTTTAGYVTPGTTATQIVGMALDATGGAGQTCRILIRPA